MKNRSNKKGYVSSYMTVSHIWYVLYSINIMYDERPLLEERTSATLHEMLRLNEEGEASGPCLVLAAEAMLPLQPSPSHAHKAPPRAQLSMQCNTVSLKINSLCPLFLASQPPFLYFIFPPLAKLPQFPMQQNKGSSARKRKHTRTHFFQSPQCLERGKESVPDRKRTERGRKRGRHRST